MASLPSVAASGGLSRYLEEIRRFPMLEPQEEYMLAKRWQEHEDADAAQKLVTSHLRLVARIAMGYRGYGLPIGEVISEGNVGLMQAVKRFDPEKGFRLATYAMWWIKAAIQEYILRSWSLVKMGTTASQKKLFFNLRKLKGQMQAFEDGDLRPDQVKAIVASQGRAFEALWLSRSELLIRRRHGLRTGTKRVASPIVSIPEQVAGLGPGPGNWRLIGRLIGGRPQGWPPNSRTPASGRGAARILELQNWVRLSQVWARLLFCKDSN
jgi:RNA polymerase sigma factor (sigma-70 family)